MAGFSDGAKFSYPLHPGRNSFAELANGQLLFLSATLTHSRVPIFPVKSRSASRSSEKNPIWRGAPHGKAGNSAEIYFDPRPGAR
ncbi:MAG: hypothetical protein H6Q42_1809 [Deltaproteobacteria bacterium]|nr:hypothetical protein [Deltaproteobacteria bacterium]